MSQHPSLKGSKIGKKQRTVLKRYERFVELKKKGILSEGSSVFGMPKLKIVKMKIKKEKAAEKPEEAKEGVVAGATAQPAAPTPAQKAAPQKAEKKDKK